MSEPAPLRPLLLGMGAFASQPGGLNRYFADLRAGLSGLGLEPASVVVAPADPGSPRFRAVASERWPLLARAVLFGSAAGRAARTADVVDAHFALYAGAALVRRSVRRLPLVVHFQGPWSAEHRVQHGRASATEGVKRWVERAVYRRADRFVVLSPSFGRILVEDYGVLPWRIEVLTPGVDVTRFSPGDQGAARQALGLPGGFVAVAVRRLVPRMGLDVLLEAWARAALPDATLVLAGDGPARAALLARAEQLGVGASVRLVGRVGDDDLVRLYQAADVTVVPSLALEGFGLVTLESLASGTPLLVTDVDGLAGVPRLLDERMVVAPGDPAALAEALTNAAGDPAWLPSRAACRSFAQGHAWPEVAQRNLDVYRRAVEQRRRPAGRPSVVYLDHTAALGGGELALLRLLRALPEVDAHVILAEHGPLVAELVAAGISVEVLPLDPRAGEVRKDVTGSPAVVWRAGWPTLRYTVRLARRLRQLHPDVVHTNSLKSGLYGCLAARLARRPVVWHLRDRLTGDYLPAPVARVVRWAATRLPDALVANSRATLDAAGPAPGRLLRVVVPSPVDLPTSRPDRSGRHPLRCTMVGRLSPWKGQDVFLRAFAEAFPDGDEVATIVGDALFGEDEHRADLERLVDELGLTGRVELTGHVGDVAAQLDRADVLVHASVIPEPFGQVVVEGMAAGLPVVASAAGGPLEVVDPERTGLLVTPGDVGALAMALRRLVDDAGLRARLGAAAADAARRYDAAVVAGEVRDVYARLLAADAGRTA